MNYPDPPDLPGISNLIVVHGIPEGAQKKEVLAALAPGCLVSQIVLREHLENPNYPPEWAGYCYAMADLKLYSGYEGQLDVTFHGWDSDSREVFHVPEIQRFCEGFLGRKTLIYELITEHSPGLWEGMILRLLHNKDPLHPEEARSGTRLRLFGAAEQRQKRPRIRWVHHPASRSWMCDATDATDVIEKLMSSPVQPPDQTGCWGTGLRLPEPSDFPLERRPR